jgi:uncharacterized protein YbjT (DUF2867 family)
VADYLDVRSLLPAFEGIEAVFIVTPDFLNEHRAMMNVVVAAGARR